MLGCYRCGYVSRRGRCLGCGDPEFECCCGNFKDALESDNNGAHLFVDEIDYDEQAERMFKRGKELKNVGR